MEWQAPEQRGYIQRYWIAYPKRYLLGSSFIEVIPSPFATLSFETAFAARIVTVSGPEQVWYVNDVDR